MTLSTGTVGGTITHGLPRPSGHALLVSWRLTRLALKTTGMMSLMTSSDNSLTGLPVTLEMSFQISKTKLRLEDRSSSMAKVLLAQLSLSHLKTTRRILTLACLIQVQSMELSGCLSPCSWPMMEWQARSLVHQWLSSSSWMGPSREIS